MLSDAVGEVVCKWRGDETRLDDGEGQKCSVQQNNDFFISIVGWVMHIFLPVTAPKAKFGQCSCKGKCCPPATALTNLPCGNNYMMHFCTIGRGSGGGGLLQYWQVGAPMGQKLDF
jgi:hypothetical protein